MITLRLALPWMFVLAAAVALVACGASRPNARPTSKFTERHAEVFDDGVDLVADPEALGGRWRDQWSSELDRRVRAADLIALVKVHTLRTDVDLERQSTYRLLVEIQKEILGRAPEKEISLSVEEGQRGFNTIKGKEERILNQPFIAFIKWYRTANDEVAPHWHLAPASEPVLARTKWLVEERRDVDVRDEGERRVIVHENP
jgi:hypothetical protein